MSVQRKEKESKLVRGGTLILAAFAGGILATFFGGSLENILEEYYFSSVGFIAIVFIFIIGYFITKIFLSPAKRKRGTL